MAQCFGIFLESVHLQNELEIRSYNYKKLLLAYGPNKCYTVFHLAMHHSIKRALLVFTNFFCRSQASVSYNSKKEKFELQLVTCAPAQLANCHQIVKKHLQAAILSRSLSFCATVSCLSVNAST